MVETLEDRRLCSIGLSDRVLEIHGNPNKADTITVGLEPGGQTVVATVSYPGKSGAVVQTKTYPVAKIRLVAIYGGRIANDISVDQTGGTLSVETVVRAGNGNNFITTGDEQDKIVTGNGTDVVNAGNGNDTVYSGVGAETITAGNGNDVFHGGRGHDDITAGNGTDGFIDAFGGDTLLGGTGHDTFVLANIKLDPDNSYNPGKDTLRNYVPPNSQDDTPSLGTILSWLSYL